MIDPSKIKRCTLCNGCVTSAFPEGTKEICELGAVYSHSAATLLRGIHHPSSTKMEIRALVCTVFVVALFLNIAHASVLNVNQPDTPSHAFSMGRDDLKEWVHSHRPRTEEGRTHFDRTDRWYQKIAGAVKDSLLESTDFDRQPETVNARILVANVDYEGDYSSVPNNNPLTTPSPSSPPGFRKRRLLQDYSPGANEISSFRRHKGRKLLSDYAEPSPNPSTIH